MKWGLVNEGSTEKGLKGSVFCVCAEHEGETVGVARVIGDNGLAYYIQDMIVLPEYQRRGIGTAMMKRIMKFLEENAPRFAVIGLKAAKGKTEFYRRFAFIERPNRNFGPGMFMFWKQAG